MTYLLHLKFYGLVSDKMHRVLITNYNYPCWKNLVFCYGKNTAVM